MTVFLYILAFIVIGVVSIAAILLGTFLWLQASGRVDVAIRLYALDIDNEHKINAAACFERADKQAPALRTLWDKVRAPFVLWKPIRAMPWDEVQLPEKYKYWRNNVSDVGDGWTWYDTETGVWVWCGDRSAPPGVKAYRYDDPDIASPGCNVKAYHVTGFYLWIARLFLLSLHPRAWFPRFVWLAFRNVASQRDVEMGEDVTKRPVVLASSDPDGGMPVIGSQRKGWALLWDGNDCYQWRSADKFGPFGIWRNVGYKLDIVRATESGEGRASVIATWASVRGWDGE